ncbi:MAG: flagellin [Proteobacteria bacterium]|nr:flagellin [Pseudomonadota bacterium]MBI3495870.1 flagellin [Pseudomonadota bacterium]
MTSSINTNVGAFVALQNLNIINARLNAVQNQVATGLKVASAVDDASSFAIAQGIRGSIKAYAAVSQGIANGRGVATVSLAGANAISDILGDIQAKITQGENAGNSTAQQSILNADFQNLVAQINTFIANATYNGRNLLSAGSSSINVIANIDGSTLAIRSNSSFSLDSINLGNQNISSTVQAAQALSALQLAQASIATVLGNLGADTKAINFQDSFISQLSDASNVGLGSIVDADLRGLPRSCRLCRCSSSSRSRP